MFTRETLTKLHEMTAENARLKEATSESLKTAQDRYGHRTHEIEREGKKVELTEKTLWDEVFYIGVGSQAGQFLEKIHPEVFENFRAQSKMAEELKKFVFLEFGLDFTALTISDYLKMTEAMFHLMLEEQGIAQVFNQPIGDLTVEKCIRPYKAPEATSL